MFGNSIQHGKHIETVTSIIDLENLSYQRHYYRPGITIFRELLSMFEENYPERTKRIVVVRAPKVFPVAYNLIKPFMDEVTRSKIVVCGSKHSLLCLTYCGIASLIFNYACLISIADVEVNRS